MINMYYILDKELRLIQGDQVCIAWEKHLLRSDIVNACGLFKTSYEYELHAEICEEALRLLEKIDYPYTPNKMTAMLTLAKAIAYTIHDALQDPVFVP